MNICRIFLLVAIWFLLWMVSGALLGGAGGTASGFFVAYVTGFALPWIMPERLQKWTEH